MMLVTVSINGIVPCGSIHIQNVSAVTAKSGPHEYWVKVYDEKGNMTHSTRCKHNREEEWHVLAANALKAVVN